jgi:molybdopterin-binding protein
MPAGAAVSPAAISKARRTTGFPITLDEQGDERMKTSARNMLQGRVSKITTGAVNSEVEVELPDGQKITSIITIGSVKRLGLEEGKNCYAMIKASSVMLAVD